MPLRGTRSYNRGGQVGVTLPLHITVRGAVLPVLCWMAEVARPKGFEPLTPRFVVWCSIQLSYGRVFTRVAGLNARCIR